MTERIEEIEAREKAATPGPWYWWHRVDDQYGIKNHEQVLVFGDRHPIPTDWDFSFIAHAREDIPYLLAQLREARGKLEAVENLPKGWHPYYEQTAGDEWWIEQLDRILYPQEAE